MTDQPNNKELLVLTSQVVEAYVGNNSIASTDLTGIIEKVYHSLVLAGSAQSIAKAARPAPAVSIKKSITPDYIICLEDGKKLKMLKRHLKKVYKMSVDEYRQRWDLPSDYPMVAPNYSQKRSMIAKHSGLGIVGKKNLRRKA
jgi:predicted transcriptional regulator